MVAVQSHHRAYDVTIRLTERVDRNGRVMKFGYDDVGRLTSEEWYSDVYDVTADQTISYGYDQLGRLTSQGDSGHEYTYQYDELDRLTVRSLDVSGLTDTINFYYVYDVASRFVASVAMIGSTVDAYNIYSYDNLNRLTQITQQGIGAGHHDLSEKRVDFTYDAASQIDTITRYADLDGTTAVATTNYDFDKAGRLSSIEHHEGGSLLGDLLAGYGYTYDHRSRLVAIDFLPSAYDSEDVEYSYDNRHQLIGAEFDGVSNDESYEYDENGNRINGGFTVGVNNRLLSDGVYDYDYDNEGNLVLRTKINDGSYTAYEFDHRNRLVKVIDFDDEENEIVRVEYCYDADNQLIGRKVFENGSGTASSSGVFVHDMGQIVLQFDRLGGGDVHSDDLSHRYLWGPAVDQLFADEQVDWTDTYADGSVYWGLTDHLGTPRDWVDNEAEVVDHAIYDSFGNRLNAKTIDAALEWTGKYRDPITGLQWNLNRWYNPAIQRWMSEDPIKDGVNWSVYVGNSPTHYVDPTGLAEDEFKWLPDESRGKWSGERGNSRFDFKDPRTPSVTYINGQPDFRTWTYQECVGQERVDAFVAIDLDSDLSRTDDARRKADYAAADKKMREKLKNPNWERPDGYTWHHQWVDGKGRGQMVLVKTSVHQAASHRGAFSMWTAVLKAREAQAAGEAGAVKALREAHARRRSLGYLGKAARVGMPAVTVFCVFSSAKKGWAADGAYGAGLEVARDAVMADEVEYLFTLPAYKIGEHLHLNKEGDKKRLLRRFGHIDDGGHIQNFADRNRED